MVHHPHGGRLSRAKSVGAVRNPDEVAHHESSFEGKTTPENILERIRGMVAPEIVWRHFSQEILETFEQIQSEIVNQEAIDAGLRGK